MVVRRKEREHDSEESEGKRDGVKTKEEEGKEGKGRGKKEETRGQDHWLDQRLTEETSQESCSRQKGTRSA